MNRKLVSIIFICAILALFLILTYPSFLVLEPYAHSGGFAPFPQNKICNCAGIGYAYDPGCCDRAIQYYCFGILSDCRCFNETKARSDGIENAYLPCSDNPAASATWDFEGELRTSNAKCDYYLHDAANNKTILVCNKGIDRLHSGAIIRVKGAMERVYYECSSPPCAMANQWIEFLNVTAFEVVRPCMEGFAPENSSDPASLCITPKLPFECDGKITRSKGFDICGHFITNSEIIPANVSYNTNAYGWSGDSNGTFHVTGEAWKVQSHECPRMDEPGPGPAQCGFINDEIEIKTIEEVA